MRKLIPVRSGAWCGCACLVILLLWLFPVSCQIVRITDGRFSAVSDPYRDRLFQRNQGWTGADVVQTISLEDGRILWLFGDTWIGSIQNNQHAPGSYLVNNSIAISFLSASGTAHVPHEDRIRFLWGEETGLGEPSAWIKPGLLGSESILFSNDRISPDTWYWPTGDGIVLPDENGRNRLVLFLSKIKRREGDYGVWGFIGAGGSVVVIDNYREDPSRWVVAHSYHNPYAVEARHADPSNDRFETSWGMALVNGRECDQGLNGYLYIYGIREITSACKKMILARSPAGAPERFESWEFFTRDRTWSSRLQDAYPLADNLVNEFSVDRITVGNKNVYVMIQSDGAFKNQIWLRTALRPEGPWSGPALIYTATDALNCKDCFAYAAKSHLCLSEPGELLVSYVINSSDFNILVNNTDIYRPRFIRVSLKQLE